MPESQPTAGLRRARLIALVVATALVVGALHGLLLAAVGSSSFLFTWWGTTLRAAVAVVVCLAVAGPLERRWSSRDTLRAGMDR